MADLFRSRVTIELLIESETAIEALKVLQDSVALKIEKAIETCKEETGNQFCEVKSINVDFLVHAASADELD